MRTEFEITVEPETPGAPVGCCTPAAAATCCEPTEKEGCCGPQAAAPDPAPLPARCGCR